MSVTLRVAVVLATGIALSVSGIAGNVASVSATAALPGVEKYLQCHGSRSDDLHQAVVLCDISDGNYNMYRAKYEVCYEAGSCVDEYGGLGSWRDDHGSRIETTGRV